MDGNWTIVGDPHAKPDNLDKINALFDILESLGESVIFLGDFLDTKEVVRSKCFNLIMDRMLGSKLWFYILVGNHDWHNLQCQDHSLQALKLLKNVEVIDTPCVRPLGRGGGSPALMVPYLPFDQFRNVLKSDLASQAKTLIMHQGVTGFDYGNGFIAEDEIDPSELKGFKLVISGHFHKFQKTGNLVYLGTPFSHSFGESNQVKYLGHLSTDPVPKLAFSETTFPRHQTLELDCDGPARGIVWNEIKKRPKDHYRVILTGSQESINKFDRTNWTGVKFIERPSGTEQSETQVSETDSNEAKFHKWASEVRKLEPETVKLGLEILRGVE